MYVSGSDVQLSVCEGLRCPTTSGVTAARTTSAWVSVSTGGLPGHSTAGMFYYWNVLLLERSTAGMFYRWNVPLLEHSTAGTFHRWNVLLLKCYTAGTFYCWNVPLWCDVINTVVPSVQAFDTTQRRRKWGTITPPPSTGKAADSCGGAGLLPVLQLHSHAFHHIFFILDSRSFFQSRCSDVKKRKTF